MTLVTNHWNVCK